MRWYLVWTAWLLQAAIAADARAFLAQPAPEAPLATSAVGQRIEITTRAADGKNSRVASFTPRTPAARRGAPRARQVAVAGRRVVEVRVPVLGGKTQQQEVWIADLGPADAAAPAPASTIWSGLVGAQDVDGETTRDVALGEQGIELFQAAARLTRCDGVPARLFAQAWDFAQRRWVPRGPALPAGGGPVLQAHRGAEAMPRGRPMGGFFWTGASTGAGATDVRSLPAPGGLDDGDPATVWRAGAGEAAGAFITARSGSAGVAVTGLRVLPGDASDLRAFRAAGRPRRLVLLLGRAPEQRFEVELVEDEDGGAARFRQPFWIPLPKPVVTSCVTVMVREAWPGTKPLALSDLDVVTDVDAAGGVERVVQAMLSNGGADCEARVPMLVGQGEPAIAATAAAVVKAGAGGARECLLEALERLTAATPANGAAAPAPRSAAVAAAFAAALVGASRSEEKLVLGAVPRLGSAAVGPLAGLLGDGRRSEEDRVRAARALAALRREEANAVLVRLAGAEPPALRAAIRELLASARPPATAAVEKALADTGAAATARRADLLYVLGAAAAVGAPETRAAALALLADAGRAAQPFEVRARAVGALGRLGDEAAVAALIAVRSSSSEPVLRHLAVRELAAATGPQALPALRAALDDADPRVRETAAVALGQRRDQAAGARLIAAARRERWPFARRAQIAAVGHLCPAGGSELLAQAAQRDLPEVRRAAFGGLVRCRDPRARTLLTAALDRRTEHPEIRAQAARLLGELGDRGAAPALAEAVKRIRVESQADLALETSAVVAMQTLTGFGGKEAVGAALALVGDERPVLKKAGIEALGRLCDKSASAALAAAARDTDLSVSGAAAAAQRRCQQPP